MRHNLLFSLAAAAFLPALAQQTNFSCDFSNGFPEGVGLYDLDRCEPSVDMKNLGFDIDIPWIVAADKDGNMAAVSTSWYRVPGTSDDWMVLPAATVSSPQAVLRWKAKAGDRDYRDGYSVYISEKGDTPDDFDRSAPVFSIASEKAAWTDHEVSLADFIGKTVYIAFVNDTKDCSTLWIDDIMVGVPACLEVTSMIPRVVEKAGVITVSGHVSNTSVSDIDGFTVSYRFGDGEIYTETIDKKVKAGGTNSFSFDGEVSIAKNETLSYQLTVEANGETSSTEGKVSAYARRVVAEEVTGTWCGYCVRGIANMEAMNDEYADSFLGIAVHNGIEGWEDPMAFPEYTDWLFDKFNMGGYPHCAVNRQLTNTGDPGNLYYYYNQVMQRDHYIGLGLTAEVDAGSRTLKAHASLFSARDIEEANLRLCYVIIENDVHCDDVAYDEQGNPLKYNGWEQNNYYAGGGMGEMGGFEDLPGTIPGADMWYQDVARYISDGFEGIEGSVPAQIREGEEVIHEETIAMPETIRVDANTELAVLLINSKNGEIVNAEKFSLRDFFDPDGVDTVQADACGISISARDGRIVAASASSIVMLKVFSADGRCVASYDGNADTAQLDINGLRGPHIILAVAADGSRKSIKTIL